MSDDALHFSGIDGSTGGYLHPELSVEEAVASVEPGDKAQLEELALRLHSSQSTLAMRRQYHAEKLSKAGWGLVVPAGTSKAVLDALEPLCAHRRDEAGARFRRFDVPPGDSKQKFLERNGMGPGPANPDRIPYYLLLLGPPRDISFRFQYELDVQYAVGRVCFDTPEEYRRYAETVVAAERPRAEAPRRAWLFGPKHDGDRATELSETLLLAPLVDELASEAREWSVDAELGVTATKQRLCELLWDGDAPALLVTVGHGVGFPSSHKLRDRAQGALLCSDWLGPPRAEKPVPEGAYLAAADVKGRGPVRPRVVFAFACYGAGTPDADDFRHRDGGRSTLVVEGEPAMSRLPQRLLAHPEGGALAFVGHVDRAWAYSFAWPGAGGQTEVFTSTLLAMMDGLRVGHAMEYFNARAAEISSELTTKLYGRKRIDGRDLSGLWTANNDARSYVIVGDPAVRATGG